MQRVLIPADGESLIETVKPPSLLTWFTVDFKVKVQTLVVCYVWLEMNHLSGLFTVQFKPLMAMTTNAKIDVLRYNIVINTQ